MIDKLRTVDVTLRGREVRLPMLELPAEWLEVLRWEGGVALTQLPRASRAPGEPQGWALLLESVPFLGCDGAHTALHSLALRLVEARGGDPTPTQWWETADGLWRLRIRDGRLLWPGGELTLDRRIRPTARLFEEAGAGFHQAVMPHLIQALASELLESASTPVGPAGCPDVQPGPRA